jgi:hypothetical protein
LACAIIIRRHDAVQSYLVLSPGPRELLRHPGFQDEFEVRPWRGSLDPLDALEEWAEMMGEDPDSGLYCLTDEENWEYCLDRANWDKCG